MLMWGLTAYAQQPPAPEVGQTAPADKTFSQEELEQILAPIALHPDALLAQILMASTYPLEIVQAARWVSANPNVTGQALETEMAKQPWDPSVKSLAAVPQILQQMSDKLEWMQKLGDAFLAQKEDVMATVQALRAKAAASGNLNSTPQQVVKTETIETKTVYVIESAQPEVVYVPAYNPAVVYGSWAYPAYPPYSVYPPSYAYAPGLAFATGVVVGAAIWGGCNWGRNDVNVNVNRYNSFNRTHVSNSNWSHNVAHRGGVAYGNRSVANRYNRGTGSQAARSREAYRGRGDVGGRGGVGGVGGAGGRGDVGSRGGVGGVGGVGGRGDVGGRGGVGGVGGAGGRGDVGSRGGVGGGVGSVGGAGGRGDVGSRGGAGGASGRGNAGSRGGGGFGGMNSGSGTRAASARGGASRGGGGGGRRGR